jgi:hypothetical protein
MTRILTKDQVRERGLNYTDRYDRYMSKLSRLGKLPGLVPMSPGGRSKGYVDDEIEDHIAARIAERNAKGGAK